MPYARLNDKMSVAPQITPDDLPELVQQGFKAVVCNRPDFEVPPDLSSEAMRAACEGAGVAFFNNPLAPGGLTGEAVTAQAQAMNATDGPVLAYCASGTRSAILWAFATAGDNEMTSQDILKALDTAGYAFPGIGPQLEQFSSQNT
ncbi:TIGR01244 family sulfur transferase [Boseongicola aestuarii]|jgi:uncharacterized protein (TIGR01244 family)|uniref:Beta-lactamase hydrolase-like protein n=1 Tax=Boseongicola aestuarii TaxID=1470561 RepID=A0A238J5L0_9RHOB|nr:TIGR01244 family sulfur transferase [Boseongicola aestuarii]SMX25230.1 Beta-lactamase hydrolase-like protein [Boseongicola aestuarii]